MESPFVGIRLRLREDCLEIQSFLQQDAELDTITINLSSGEIEKSEKPNFARDCTIVPGLIGLLRLNKITAVITIKKAKQVALSHGVPVFEIEESGVIAPSKGVSPEDKELLDLVKLATDPLQAGRGLYYSYGTNLTLSAERLSAIANDKADAFWKSEDPRFFWNRHLTKPLAEIGAHGLVLPVVQGFVRQIKGLNFGSRHHHNITCDLTLIARRSVNRLGTRHWRRGADKEGWVANYVETEQHLLFSTGHECSFVQVRGSIPVFWTNIPNINYKPPTILSRELEFMDAFDKHISDMVTTYKEVIAVNLAHADGSEGLLTSAFDGATRRYSRTKKGFRLINFDFHKECGTTRYHRLSILFDQIQDDIKRFDQFTVADGRVTNAQQGVIRTNCVDCLDRTNVVQTIFGRYMLESFLRRIHVLRDNSTLPDSFPEVEAEFKVVWADHGDEVSKQYSGTGALKSDFTRTGKRSINGLIDDGVKSIKRYYLNNFEDGRRQDALDLISGAFVVGRDPMNPYLQRPPDLLLYLLILLIFYGFTKFTDGVFGLVLGFENSGNSLTMGVIGFVSAAVLWKGVILKNGPKLVCKPKLRPDLPRQW